MWGGQRGGGEEGVWAWGRRGQWGEEEGEWAQPSPLPQGPLSTALCCPHCSQPGRNRRAFAEGHTPWGAPGPGQGWAGGPCVTGGL